MHCASISNTNWKRINSRFQLELGAVPERAERERERESALLGSSLLFLFSFLFLLFLLGNIFCPPSLRFTSECKLVAYLLLLVMVSILQSTLI